MEKNEKKSNSDKQFSYDDHFPEGRRCHCRNGIDRRQDQRYDLNTFQKTKAVSIMSLIFS